MHQVSFSNKYLLLKVDKYLLTFVINILNAVENYQTNIIIYTYKLTILNQPLQCLVLMLALTGFDFDFENQAFHQAFRLQHPHPHIVLK